MSQDPARGEPDLPGLSKTMTASRFKGENLFHGLHQRDCAAEKGEGGEGGAASVLGVSLGGGRRNFHGRASEPVHEAAFLQ